MKFFRSTPPGCFGTVRNGGIPGLFLLPSLVFGGFPYLGGNLPPLWWARLDKFDYIYDDYIYDTSPSLF